MNRRARRTTFPRTTGATSVAALNSFGLGLCSLLGDAFQLDIYYALGFARGGELDRGVSVALRQAY